MHNFARKTLTAVLTATLALVATGALAVDAPKWVAALHVSGQNAVGLRWMAVPGATSYKVLRSGTAGSGHEEIASTPQPQYFDKDVAPGEAYYYVLQAAVAGEVSPLSLEKKILIPGQKIQKAEPPKWDRITLDQVTEFGETVSKVGLKWTTSGSGAIAYNVYRTVTPGKDYEMVTSSSETQFIDTNVEVGKTYYYAVSSLDQTFTETPYSEESSIEITVPKVKAKKVRKEKVMMKLRESRLVNTIDAGLWGTLTQPTGIAFDSDDNLYIADLYQSMIYVFNDKEEFLFRFGKPGLKPGTLRQPIDLAVDPDDNVYVVGATPRVEVFRGRDGSHLKTIVLADVIKDGQGHVPSAVSCGPDYWYLTDAGTHALYTFEYGSNALVSTFGKLGEEVGSLRAPKRAYFSERHGLLFLADTFNFRIYILDGAEEPEVIRTFGSYGNSVTQFARLMDVGEDDMGNVLAVDYMNANVQAFSPEGEFQYVVGNENISGQINLVTPIMAIMKGKRLYVSQQLGSKVEIYELGDTIGRPNK